MQLLVVTGASGLIGAEVCRQAVARGIDVLGIARGGRGEPAEGPAALSGRPEHWADSVSWVAADIWQPERWRDRLRGAAAVAHCTGILWQHPSRGVTYQHQNGDAPIAVAREAARAGVPAFVFISASHNPPLFPRSYLEAKRRAEREIAALPLRSAFVRPSFVYGPRRPRAIAVGLLMNVAAGMLPIAYLRNNRALRVERVAAAVLHAAFDPGVRGVVDIDAVERWTTIREETRMRHE